MKDKAFLIYLNNFRGFSMLMIVAVHSMYLIEESAPDQYKYLDLVLSNSSVYLLFISGFLFQHLSGGFD